MTLRLNNRSWRQTFFSFSKPKAVGYFSYDGNRKISFDSTQLKYYRPYTAVNNNIYLDLDHGIHDVVRKPSNYNQIDRILRWIQYKYPDLKLMMDEENWLHTDFVCNRGLLSKMMLTPYIKQDGWIICAVKFKGTIYLCEYYTEAEKHTVESRTMENLTIMSWGFKFEQYLVSDRPNTVPNTDVPVNESEAFYCIYETHLKRNSILYCAEMDGIDSDEILFDPLPLEKLKFVELKTTKIVEHPYQYDRMKKSKYVRWWCQSFLVGIEDLICGFRDNNGIVRKIKHFRISDLPRMSEGLWKPSEFINFGDYFLSHIAKTVVNNYDETIYKFEREPYGDIIMTELPPSSEYAFLPDWYTHPEN